MKPIIMAGVTIVNFALLFYSIGVISEQRKHRITKGIRNILTLGIIFDVVATVCMIIGSENSPFSPHGLLGYTSLTAMLVDVVLVWRFTLANGFDTVVPKWLHLYSRYAYLWWVAAYITGGILVATAK